MDFKNILNILGQLGIIPKQELVSPEPSLSPAANSNLPQQPEWISGSVPPVRPQNQLLNALTPSPTPAPQSTDSFKYSMGQNDYSSLIPQIQGVLKDTPLAAYSGDFINAANKYGVDPRVLLTIANNESSLGKNYPVDTYNPFGYLVGGGGVEGLKGAGFTSLSHAIDALTSRFARQPDSGYKQFYADPTVGNLQYAYNRTDAEKETYLKNAGDFISKVK